jgi:L-2-hydroxyglutarate oxidase LhgO
MSVVQSLVIGGGAVGLSIARVLVYAGREVLLVDRASRVGSGTSSRNSGVVHAGLYYDKGSLKASTCIEGSWMLRRFCDIYNVPINKCGKLVVARSKVEDAKLQQIYTRAIGLGARDLVLIDGNDARRFEPNLGQNIVGAIWSPHTAVIDAGAFTEALLEDCSKAGGDKFMFSAKSEVSGIEFDGDKYTVTFLDGSNIVCSELINAAGLHATDVTRSISRSGQPVVAERDIPAVTFAKGSYFRLSGKHACPFERLIYPTRISGHLGIHFTMDTAGGFRFGPNDEKLDGVKSLPKNLEQSGLFDVDPIQAIEFRQAVSDYWEQVPEPDEFVPDYAGIRPKVEGGDFKVDKHGMKGFIGLYGIDSPGLTAALSLAHRVADMLGVQGVVTPEMKSQHVYEWES